VSISNFLSSPCPPFSLRPFVRFIVTLPGQTPVHHEHKRREREQKERGMKKSDDPIIMAETGKHYSNDRARNCLAPGCAASKSKLKLQRNRSDHIFSHFSRTFCRSERRHRFPFTVWVGWCPHHLSPYHLSISGPSFSFTSIASVSGTRISPRSHTQQVLYPPLSTGDLSLSLRFH